MKKIGLMLAATLLLTTGIQAANATNAQQVSMTPFVCDTDSTNPIDVTAQWIQVPNRHGFNLQLFLNDHEPLFDDIPGGFLVNSKGPFTGISYAVNGIINDARVGPHVTGFYTAANHTQVFFDQASSDGTVSAPDAQGYRTVTFTPAQLGIPIGATTVVLTINIGGRANNKAIPVTELIDSIFVNGRQVNPTTDGHGIVVQQFTCPFPSN